jgi:hypothetical protein
MVMLLMNIGPTLCATLTPGIRLLTFSRNVSFTWLLRRALEFGDDDSRLCPKSMRLCRLMNERHAVDTTELQCLVRLDAITNGAAFHFHSGRFSRFSISWERGSSRKDANNGSTFNRKRSQSRAAKAFSSAAKALSFSPKAA